MLSSILLPYDQHLHLENLEIIMAHYVIHRNVLMLQPLIMHCDAAISSQSGCNATIMQYKASGSL